MDQQESQENAPEQEKKVEERNPINELKVKLAGGMDVAYTDRDGNEQFIFVKKIPFLKSDRLGSAWGKIIPELKLYLDMTEEQINALPDDALSEAYKVGRKINFFTCKEYMEQQALTMEVFDAGKTETFDNDMKALMREFVKEEMKSRLGDSENSGPSS